MSSVWVLIGGLLILPLAGYAIFLGAQLRQQRRAQRALDQQLTEQRINDDRDARQAVQINCPRPIAERSFGDRGSHAYCFSGSKNYR